MGAPRKAYAVKLVKNQPEKRLASTSEPNSAPGGVIRHREARKKGYQAATQVKGLSLEIFIILEADVFHICGKQQSHSRYWQGYGSPAGSETVAWYQMDSMGTRETRSIPLWVWSVKPNKGKMFQMVLRESDQFIVARKQGNACGAKGLTGKLNGDGETSYALRCGQREGTKPTSKTRHSAEEIFLKSRMREIRKSGSVRGFMADSRETIFQGRWS